MANDHAPDAGKQVWTDLREAGTIKVKLPAGGDESEQSHNMSGLCCPRGERWGLMVADEKQGLHRLGVNRDVDPPTVSYDRPLELDLPSEAFLEKHGMKKKDLDELDLEAIAEVGDDGPLARSIIFVGSHANKRNSGEVNPGAHLIAVADKEELGTKANVNARWASLDGLLRELLPNALDQELQRGGVNIEGATVFGDKLLIGLRSPTCGRPKPGALVISTPLDGLLDEDFTGADWCALPTGERLIGIRAMETVGDTVLIVTGDAGVNDAKLPKEGPPPLPRLLENLNEEDPARMFRLCAWTPRKGNSFGPEPLVVFPPMKSNDPDAKETDRAKVEGIAVAHRDGKRISLFIVYDGNDKVFYLPNVELP